MSLVFPLLLAPLTVLCKMVFVRPDDRETMSLVFPLLLAPLTVPCKMVFARPDDRETCSVSLLSCSQGVFMAPEGILDPASDLDVGYMVRPYMRHAGS